MPITTNYKAHLSKDKKLKKLVDTIEIRKLVKRKNLFHYLCASILSQQLSTKVAKVIHNRFLDLFDGREPTPEQLLKTSHDKLRSVGLSNAKANYVKNVAQFEIEHGMQLSKLNKMSNDEVIAYLTQIKGVGKWTVEMLLMFALGREDVFPMDDWGIQQAMIKLYNLDNSDKKLFRDKLAKISSTWQPYQTYACLYLWDWKDGN